MRNNSPARAVFPELYPSPSANRTATLDTGIQTIGDTETQTTPEEPSNPTPKTKHPPAELQSQPQPGEPSSAARPHNGTPPPSTPAPSWRVTDPPPPPESAALRELRCPVEGCQVTFTHGDSQALMDHLHWYWVRARRARLRAVVLGIFEEAHAVCYYLTSGDDEQREECRVRREEGKEE